MPPGRDDRVTLVLLMRAPVDPDQAHKTSRGPAPGLSPLSPLSASWEGLADSGVESGEARPLWPCPAAPLPLLLRLSHCELEVRAHMLQWIINIQVKSIFQSEQYIYASKASY